MVRIKGEASQLYLVMGVNGTLSAQVCIVSLFSYDKHASSLCSGGVNAGISVLLIARYFWAQSERTHEFV